MHGRGAESHTRDNLIKQSFISRYFGSFLHVSLIIDVAAMRAADRYHFRIVCDAYVHI